MQTVLITGANGFLGNYLSKLLANDYKVIATGRGKCRLSFVHPNFHYKTLDLTNNVEIKNIFNVIQPDIVIHAGAMTKPDECELHQELAYKTNVISTEYLLENSRNYKCHFVFVSTDFVFDGQKGMYTEEDQPNPVNYYGKTKWLAEQAVKAYPFEWSIVRTVLVYGHPKAGRDNILTIVSNALKAGKKSYIVDDQFRTPTYVEDLAGAIQTIIKKRAEGIFHIAGKDLLTPYKMTLSVAQYLKQNEELIIPVNASTFQQPALRPPRTGFSINKAAELLDYQPISFEEGIKRTFAD